jgi:uncharacterized Tic20 family protein
MWPPPQDQSNAKSGTKISQEPMNDIPQKSSRIWEVLCHLSALTVFVGVPFGNILGPLIIWLIKKGEAVSVDEHGKESLNFQISLALYLLAGAGITLSLIFVIIGILLVPVLIAGVVIGTILDVIFVIIAAVKARNGELFRYPLTIRLIK